MRATGAAKVDREAERNPQGLSEVQRQVNEYAKGKRQEFEFELKAEGPDFDKMVWDALLEIPFGTTTTYGAIAKTRRFPAAARAVGAANGANPDRPDRALSPGDRRRGQPHRLWRRAAAQAQASGA